MIKLDTVKRILNAHKDALHEKYGVTEIAVFGSFVRNENSEASDLDLMVEFDKAIDLFTLVNSKNYLSDLLRSTSIWQSKKL
jgi:hypothetical protein